MSGVGAALKEHRLGTLKTSDGKTVTDRKHAVAIGRSGEKTKYGASTGADAAAALANRKKE